MLCAAIARGSSSAVSTTTQSVEFAQRFVTDTPRSFEKTSKILPEDLKLLRGNVFAIMVWFFGQAMENQPVLALTCKLLLHTNIIYVFIPSYQHILAITLASLHSVVSVFASFLGSSWCPCDCSVFVICVL